MNSSLFFSENEARIIHKSALKVLENTGVSVDHHQAQKIYLSAGAKKEDGRILIPGTLVEEALENVSPSIQMYDRDGRESILLEDGCNYFGPGSDALYNIDTDTWQLRRTILSDISRNVKIADSLGFDFMMSMGLPEDIGKDVLYPAVFAEMVKNTAKPLVVTSTSPADIEVIHQIAVAVAGNKEELRNKPFWLAYLEPISPLQMDRSGIERLLYCVENDIPVLYAPGANSGSGAPVSAEGGVIQGSAECLAGLVLAWLKNKDVKFVFGANTSSMDMKKMIVCYGAPEWARTVAIYAGMGRYYNMPSWGTAGCSDTFRLDPQAAWEAGESILMAVISKTTLAHDVGFLGHGELYDPRMLVLTAEMIKRARHLTKPLNFDEDSLQGIMEVIDDVSRGRDIYPAHPHTVHSYREHLWLPPEFINRGFVSEIEGGSEFNEILKDRVTKLLAEDKTNRLAKEKVKKVNYLSGGLKNEL